ncbi:autotransporter outer membrane beta-barrel domain-containing protein [Endozoicomonas sp. SCSIO W0465]|uniref:autotransporter outer membrane beta-barrel domain-containing protein n=1 Tax=Endozoicomonas sp. SCSIO W0465 TaxID=2918516 RepID=UPI002074C564|nr:autotransporter outer membrane beta-barrel domain-containing protein [Endozoicomonas sp. SCSIO W0465]USE36054.1 autotransporter outer membrane beta-barrel domain-containing protein [Endozoicomonas sp. SCSIO W0465]
MLNSYNVGKDNTKTAELAPAISPHAIHNANLALKAAGKTLDDRMSGKRTGINTGDIFSTGSAWVQYSYSKATQDIKDNVPGYHAKTNGFSIGTDNPLKEDQDIEVGIAYTYANGKVEGSDGSRNKIDTDTNIFSLYSSYIEDDFFFDGRMSYSFGKNTGHRFVGDSLHDAKYHTRSWGVGMIAGYTYPLGDEWSWQPQVAFDYYTIKTDDYSESARDPAQAYLSYDQVNNGKYDIMELGAGLKLAGEITTDAMVIKPEVRLMGFHDFKKDPIAITAHFAAGGENFLINGADRDANRYQFDASMTMEIQSNTTITFNYSHHWADNFTVDGFIARVRHDF